MTATHEQQMTPIQDSSALTLLENQELEACEKVIEQGRTIFLEVGEALACVRDKRLYRDTHRTFEDYCRQRWKFSKTHANRMIGAAETVENLTPMGVIPTSERQVRPLTPLPPAQQAEAWQEAVETAPQGKVTAAHVQSVVVKYLPQDPQEAPPRPHIVTAPAIDLEPETISASLANHQHMHSSKSVEWYTPTRYASAAWNVMGGIDLDPASNALANETVQATRFFTREENGLKQEWSGRVFLNPPYGKDEGERESNQAKWSHRLRMDFEKGRIEQAILLVNAATSEKWFLPLWKFPICFTDHRIEFNSPEGESGGPTHGSAFVYMGKHPRIFARYFSEFGVIATGRREGWKA